MADPLLWDDVRALLPEQAVADVLDVGGGTGGLAVPIAALGHRVTVVDPSPDALAALDRRLGELAGAPGRPAAGTLVARQGDADDLALGGETFDLVLCHGVLEHVDDPAAALAGLVAPCDPADGSASSSPSSAPPSWPPRCPARSPGPRRCWSTPPAGLGRVTRWPGASTASSWPDLATAAGLVLERLHGLQALSGLVSGHLLESDPGSPGRLAALDARLAGRPDYAGPVPLLAPGRPSAGLTALTWLRHEPAAD